MMLEMKSYKTRYIHPERLEGNIPSRKVLIERGLFEDKCASCGRREGDPLPNGKKVHLTKDHIIPVSKGGKNVLSNIQLLCYQCNQEKGNN